jgi:hypothetical protein
MKWGVRPTARFFWPSRSLMGQEKGDSLLNEVHTMDLSSNAVVRGLVSLPESVTHGATPLTLGVFAIVAGFGFRLITANARYPSRSVLEVLALWVMACASTLLWLKCLLILHSQGLA